MYVYVCVCVCMNRIVSRGSSSLPLFLSVSLPTCPSIPLNNLYGESKKCITSTSLSPPLAHLCVVFDDVFGVRAGIGLHALRLEPLGLCC